MCLCLVIRRLAGWLGKHLDKMEVGDADRLALCTVLSSSSLSWPAWRGRWGGEGGGIDLVSQVREGGGGGGGGGGISNIENNVL